MPHNLYIIIETGRSHEVSVARVFPEIPRIRAAAADQRVRRRGFPFLGVFLQRAEGGHRLGARMGGTRTRQIIVSSRSSSSSSRRNCSSSSSRMRCSSRSSTATAGTTAARAGAARAVFPAHLAHLHVLKTDALGVAVIPGTLIAGGTGRLAVSGTPATVWGESDLLTEALQTTSQHSLGGVEGGPGQRRKVGAPAIPNTPIWACSE